MDIYINGGTGFHSNDARDVIIASRINQIIETGMSDGLSNAEIDQKLSDRFMDPMHSDIKTLPRASGAEIGGRLALGSRILASIAAWYLHMEEELVYVGDAGTTEISGETQRLGIDLEVRFQLAEWIWGDLDLNLADPRIIGEASGSNYVPLAPRLTSQGGINLLHPKGFEGALRYRYLADRPANEDNSVVATGHLLANLVLGYRFEKFRVFGQAENLLNIDWNEAQFDTLSRLPGESAPVSELHYTPGNPFNVQLGVAFEF
jgi:hypothetical protein